MEVRGRYNMFLICQWLQIELLEFYSFFRGEGNIWLRDTKFQFVYKNFLLEGFGLIYIESFQIRG